MSDLWIPPDYIRRQQISRQIGVLTTVTWSDVAGSVLTDTELQSIVGAATAGGLLRVISLISTLLTNVGWSPYAHRDQQCAAARELCSADVAGTVEQLLVTQRRDVFVHHAQLLAAARLAILYGQPGSARPSDGDVIGKVLLAINDSLQREELEQADPHASAIMVSLRGLGLFRNEQWRYLMPRYFDLLVTRARNHPIGKDFAPAFYSATGVEMEAYICFALLYLSAFQGITEARQLESRAFLDAIDGIVRQVRDQDLVRRCQALFSDDLEGFRNAFTPPNASTRTPGHHRFQERPLVRLPGGVTLPISLPLLHEKASMGAYWLLHEHYRCDPTKGIRKFTSTVGKFFQDYLSDLLKRTYAAGPGDERYYDEASIKASSHPPRGRNEPPFDGIILGNDSIILIEMGTAALTADLLRTGDPAEFSRQVNAKVVKKIEQLNKAFNEIGQGFWRAPGLELRRISHIYPVLALLHPYPLTSATWQPLRSAAQEPGMYPFGGDILSAHLHWPQLIAAEEWEMLEPLVLDTGLSLPQVRLKRPGQKKPS